MVDQIPAADKPTGGVKFHLASGSTGGTIEVDAQPADTYMTITDSTSSSATIATTDGHTYATANDISGAGVDNIILQTNDLNGTTIPAVSDYYPNGGTEVYVPQLSGGLNLRVNTGDATYDQIDLGDNSTVGGATTVQTGQGHDRVNVQDSAGDDDTNAIVDFGSGIGDDHETGRGNELNVNSAATATLEPVDGGTGPVVVDTVNVSGDSIHGNIGTLLIPDDVTIGTLNVNPNGSAKVTGTGSATIASMNVYGSGTVYIEGESTIEDTLYSNASVDITAPCTIGTLEVDGGITTIEDTCTIDTAEVSTEGDLEATGPCNITNLAVGGTANFYGDDKIGSLTDDGSVSFNTGTTTITSADFVGTLTVDEGENLTLDESSTIGALVFADGNPIVTLAPRDEDAAARVLTILNGISLGEADAPVGQVNLNDNDLIVAPDEGTSYPSGLSYYQELIKVGYDGGAWDGDGIISGDANEYTALGYATKSELGDPSSFQDVDINSDADTAVIIKYTWKGDANLDGSVGSADESIVASNYGGHPKDWSQGDFNYDGTTNALDFNLLATNWGKASL